jgi:ataxia telangiectasia mutated family protein
MSQISLNGTLEQICGEKIKDRQEGLTAIRTAFSTDAAINKFSLKSDRWSRVFKALFTTVSIEKKAFFGKKGTAAAERRLGDVANIVRWLVERSVNRLDKKTIKALLEHLVNAMVHNGQLVSSLSLDYFKAIRCILLHHSHLENLNDGTWVVILRTTFNVILGDHVKMELYEPSEANQELTDVEDLVEIDDNMTDETSGPRKRRRTEEATPPSRAHGRRASPLRLTSLEQTECAAILAVLLQSPLAPILSLDYPYLPTGILDRLLLILKLFPPDSSLHHDILSATLSSVQHLRLNRRDMMIRFASKILDPLLNLWHTRAIETREKLLAILKLLFPYFGLALHEDTELSDVTVDGLGRLCDLLDSVPEGRKGGDGLDLDRVRLELADQGSSSNSHAFTAGTFRAGWEFDRFQVFAWTTHELHANCMIEVSNETTTRGRF